MTKPAKPWLAALLAILGGGLGFYYAGLGFLASVAATLLITALDAAIRFLPVTLLNWRHGFIVEAVLSVVLLAGIFVTALKVARRREPPRVMRPWWAYALMFGLMLCYGGAMSLAEDIFRLDPARVLPVTDGNSDPSLMAGDRVFVRMVRFDAVLPPVGTLVAYRDPKNRSVIHVRRIAADYNPDIFFLLGNVMGVVWSNDPDRGVRWDRLLVDTP